MFKNPEGREKKGALADHFDMRAVSLFGPVETESVCLPLPSTAPSTVQLVSKLTVE